MSAYIVGKRHIEALLRAGLAYGGYNRELRWLTPEGTEPDDFQRGEPWGRTSVANATQRQRVLNHETIAEVGRMLLMENVRSVAHRYDEPLDSDNLPSPIGFNVLEVTFSHYNVGRLRPLSPVETLKAIDGYEYQSCEHPTWENSEAHEFCKVLRGATISALPGYDDADTWHVS